jgi:hypothetical protein
MGLLIGLCAVCACNGSQLAPAAPAHLSYNGARPFPAVVGQAIALKPEVSGLVDRYIIDPQLPAGLVLDRSTGLISGVPRSASGPVSYTLSASSRGGQCSFRLVMSVTKPPSLLVYANPLRGYVGIPLAPMSPGITGEAEYYTSNPTLPPGVLLDSATGRISGTPKAAQAPTAYTITARSFAGSTRFVLQVAIAAAKPHVSR